MTKVTSVHAKYFMKQTYKKEIDNKNKKKIENYLKEMPEYVERYIKHINGTATGTRLYYIRDIYSFLEYLKDIKNIDGPVKDITVDIIDEVTPMEIDDYKIYLEQYESNGTIRTNNKGSIKRNLISIRGLYNYLYTNDFIKNNPTAKVQIPKPDQKTIVLMDNDESASLLNAAKYGDGLSKRGKIFHEINGLRDTTILSVLLGTGIRVSELVGLNITDVSLKNNSMKVIRKGNKEDIVYYSDELAEILKDYLEYRKHLDPIEGHEDALFLSSQRKRIGVRTIELMVKKYSLEGGIIKHTTPHTLRRTYGTRLYESSSDLYLVAETLGHSSVETTKKHYAAMSEKRKQAARNLVKPE